MIGEIEDWLVDTTQELMDCHFGAGVVDVSSGPAEWNGDYLKNLISSLPAVRVVWEGGPAEEESWLKLAGDWVVYVVTGWDVRTEEERRKSSMGAYRMLEILAPRFHNAVVLDASSGKSIARLRVEAIENNSQGELDRLGVTVYGIGLTSSMPFEQVETPTKPLDDFLRARVEWNIADGEEVDEENSIELPGRGS